MRRDEGLEVGDARRRIGVGGVQVRHEVAGGVDVDDHLGVTDRRRDERLEHRVALRRGFGHLGRRRDLGEPRQSEDGEPGERSLDIEAVGGGTEQFDGEHHPVAQVDEQSQAFGGVPGLLAAHVDKAPVREHLLRVELEVTHVSCHEQADATGDEVRIPGAVGVTATADGQRDPQRGTRFLGGEHPAERGGLTGRFQIDTKGLGGILGEHRRSEHGTREPQGNRHQEGHHGPSPDSTRSQHGPTPSSGRARGRPMGRAGPR